MRTYILEVHQIDVRGIGAGRFDPANTFPNSYDRGFEWNDSTINTKWGIQTYYYRYAVLINRLLIGLELTVMEMVNLEIHTGMVLILDNRINLGNGWVYTFASTMYRRRFTNWLGYYGCSIFLQNEDWEGRYKGPSTTAWSHYLRNQVYSLAQRRYNANDSAGWKINFMIPFRHSSSLAYPIGWTTGAFCFAISCDPCSNGVASKY